MDEAVADGIGEGGVGQVVVPLLGRELARDDRRSGTVSVFEDLEEVPAFTIGERGDGEVVEPRRPTR